MNLFPRLQDQNRCVSIITEVIDHRELMNVDGQI